jgi:hypothetical protein
MSYGDKGVMANNKSKFSLLKNLQILIFVLLISTTTNAQIERKTILLGGNASMIASTSGNSFFNFNPGAGIFINDKMCVGASASLMLFNEDFFWGAAPFVRYYFSPKKAQSIYVTSSIGFSNLNTNIVGLSAGAGNVWFINKNVGFETELIASTDFEDFSVGMYLGLQVYFNRNQ